MPDPEVDAVNPPEGRTSIHVRRAIEGDSESLSWLWCHVYPLLYRHAVLRIGKAGAGRIDPDDLVADAWATTLPRLRELVARNGRLAPVVLKFLGTTITNLANGRLRTLGRETAPIEDSGAAGVGDPMDRLHAKHTSIVTAAARTELAALIASELDSLSPEDRQVILLRCMDGLKNDEVARVLGLPPNTAAQRYRRAIQRLRDRLPGSFFDELSDD
jgi:RNA polymerase sigma-70 factor (ECF subfamily)